VARQTFRFCPKADHRMELVTSTFVDFMKRGARIIAVLTNS
jgi:hypothetical protein